MGHFWKTTREIPWAARVGGKHAFFFFVKHILGLCAILITMADVPERLQGSGDLLDQS